MKESPENKFVQLLSKLVVLYSEDGFRLAPDERGAFQGQPLLLDKESSLIVIPKGSFYPSMEILLARFDFISARILQDGPNPFLIERALRIGIELLDELASYSTRKAFLDEELEAIRNLTDPCDLSQMVVEPEVLPEMQDRLKLIRLLHQKKRCGWELFVQRVNPIRVSESGDLEITDMRLVSRDLEYAIEEINYWRRKALDNTIRKRLTRATTDCSRPRSQDSKLQRKGAARLAIEKAMKGDPAWTCTRKRWKNLVKINPSLANYTFNTAKRKYYDAVNEKRRSRSDFGVGKLMK